MRKILLVLIGILIMSFTQEKSLVKGKIIDDNFECLIGVRVKNLSKDIESFSDQNGEYQIIASQNDTLEFQYISLTTDKIKIEDSVRNLNLIMLDKEVNCLGANWTDKQYQIAYRQINRKLKKLYKEAEKEGVWKKDCNQSD